MQDKEVTRAGFGPRAAAYLIDRAILFVALLIVRAPIRLASLFGTGWLTEKNFLFNHSFLDVLCWLMCAVYFILLTYFTGSTLGKKVLRLRVEREDGEPLRFIDVLYRETAGRFLSGIACIGYLMALADKKKRAFHDWLCDTRVVYDQVVFRIREKEVSPAPGWTPAGAAGEEGIAYSAPDPETPAYSVPGEDALLAEPEEAAEESQITLEVEDGETEDGCL